MSATTYIADTAEQVLAALVATGVRVVAPVARDGLLSFAPLAPGQDAALTGQTRWSPKEAVFPRTEPLLSFRFGHAAVEMSAGHEPPEPTVLFGVRPCDAAGLAILDRVFLGEPVDAPYQAWREATTIVGLACAEPAGDACFCTSVGGSPTGETGSDLLLTPVDGRWLVEALTPQGAALAAGLGDALTPGELDKSATIAAAADRVARRDVPLDPDALESRFTDAAWVDEALRCLGCGTCAFICPTCHCFDLTDEANRHGGVRRRNWDACQFGLFTLHGSGHNPRPDQGARFRQRVLHKFSYFPRRYGTPMCVGCGRCIVSCPAGMDIAEVAGALAAGGA